MFKTALLGSIKPLAIIWNKCGWSPKNTLHVDDLERHFDLNKANGVLVNAFYRIGNEAKRGLKVAREQFKQAERERELFGRPVSTATTAVVGEGAAGSEQPGLAIANNFSSLSAEAAPSVFVAAPTISPAAAAAAAVELHLPDEELLLLSHYLTCDELVRSDDVSNCGLDHSEWRTIARREISRRATVAVDPTSSTVHERRATSNN